MGFQEATNHILPPIIIDGREYKAGVTSDKNGVRQDFDAPRPGRNHRGVDINYRDENGNRAPDTINNRDRDVTSPVSGKITDIKRDQGYIEIEDAYGYKHQLRHLDSLDNTLKEGDPVAADQKIGKLGSRGAGDQIHVDYKIKGRPKSQGGFYDGYIDPELYWNDTEGLEDGMLSMLSNIIDLAKNLFISAEAAFIPRIYYDPLIIDLDNDGIETIGVTDGAYFDHDGNGFAEQTGWANSDDGILVMDRNGNGIIDDGKELFGDQTILSNGQKASNGFQALAELDSNADGKIDANDAVYANLKIWKDADGDGYSSLKNMATTFCHI